MNRDRNLTVESLEEKLTLSASAIGIGAHLTAAPQVATLPHAPSTGTGYTAFASTAATQAHLPHAPSTGTGYSAF